MTHLLVIGDVGAVDGVRHVGDEAMTEAAMVELSRRGDYRFTVMSADPAETTSTYAHLGVKTIRRPGTPGGNDLNRTNRLQAITAAAAANPATLAEDDPAWDLIGAVAECDALLIAGGGNLTSLWTDRVDERLAAARLAKQFNRPILISGQTVGPALSGLAGAFIDELMGLATVVGLREQQSFDLLLSRSIPAIKLRRTIDDATFLPDAEASELVAIGVASPFILATFAPFTAVVAPDAAAAAYARLLDAVAADASAKVVFLPHEGSTGSIDDFDSAMHQRIASHLSAKHRLLPVVSNRLSASLARTAAVSVSSRYHPAVFALGADVPAITISADRYMNTKLTGAGVNFGLQDLSFPLVELLADRVEPQVAAALGSLSQTRNARESLIAARRRENAAWWDELHALATGQHTEAATWQVAPRLSIRDDSAVTITRNLANYQAQVGDLLIERRELNATIGTLRSAIAAAEMAAVEAHSEVDLMAQRVLDRGYSMRVADDEREAARAELTALRKELAKRRTLCAHARLMVYRFVKRMRRHSARK